MKTLVGLSIIAALAALVLYWPYPRDFLLYEANIGSLRSALLSRSTTCVLVVEEYMDRIRTFDHKLSSVLTINPHAIERAKELDVLSTKEKVQPLMTV